MKIYFKHENAVYLFVSSCIHDIQYFKKNFTFLIFVVFFFRLRFSSGTPNTECYIFSDMFYVEVVMEPTGAITDVKIAHQDDPVVNILHSLYRCALLKTFILK